MLVVVSFAGDKRFGLVEIHQMGKEQCTEWEDFLLLLFSPVWCGVIM
jgi:hypothetical protein